jgi:hypothetical protein
MDANEPRVPETVIRRAVADVLRLRGALSPNTADVTEEERLAWTAAVPAFIAAEQAVHLAEHPNLARR